MTLQGKNRAACWIIGINHLVGVAGLNYSATAPLFENIAWLNLLVTFLLLLFVRPPSRHLWAFVAFAFALGMAAEIAGVKTGVIFGAYHYTAALGLSVAGVPLIIGINWALLGYVIGNVTYALPVSTPLRVVIAAILMVLLDVLLEGFAIRHHLWVWHTGAPPITNFIGWLAVALVIQTAYMRVPAERLQPATRFYAAVLTVFLIADKLLALL